MEAARQRVDGPPDARSEGDGVAAGQAGPSAHASEREDEAPFALFKSRADDPPGIRKLRIAVMAMGVVLIGLFIAVAARAFHLMTRDSPRASATLPAAGSAAGDFATGRILALPPTALVPDVKVQLPVDARIKSHTLAGAMLSLHYAAAAGDGIMIIDLTTGRAVSHVRFSGN